MARVRLSALYAGRLTLAYLLSFTAVLMIVVPLGGITLSGPHAYFTEKNLVTAVSSVIGGTVAVAIGGVVNIAGTLRWFVAKRKPDQRQYRAALDLTNRQSVILASIWVVCGATFILLNLDGGAAIVVPTVFGVIFGGAAAVGTGLVLTQRAIRPILVSSAQGAEGGGLTAPAYSRGWSECGPCAWRFLPA